MSEERLRQLLSTLPEKDEITARASRARQRAFARLDEGDPARRGWVWVPALALGVALIASGAWIRNAGRLASLEVRPPAPRIPVANLAAPAPVRVAQPKQALRRPAPRLTQDRLELHWVLSDGTHVQWTFDRNFNL